MASKKDIILPVAVLAVLASIPSVVQVVVPPSTMTLVWSNPPEPMGSYTALLESSNLVDWSMVANFYAGSPVSNSYALIVPKAGQYGFFRVENYFGP